MFLLVNLNLKWFLKWCGVHKKYRFTRNKNKITGRVIFLTLKVHDFWFKNINFAPIEAKLVAYKMISEAVGS